MSETVDIWRLLAGLGIFLFGVHVMEEAIRELAGKAFKRLIRSYTDTRLSAMLSGVVSTTILQSSSAVSLMVLAFAGAGLMSLTNAIGVVMGANIGTTTTAWIVAVFGFKMSIEAFALPLIALGGVGLIVFSSSPRYLNLSRLLLGFGLLFHGLEFMKTGVEHLVSMADLTMLAGFGSWVFILAGALLTALIQSSSATIAVILTGLYSGALTFENGAALVIGANIGTTVTVMLGSIGGIPLKKRVAGSHVLFNLGTGLLAWLLLPALVWVVQSLLGWQDRAVLGIAMFHTLFNVMGVLVFMPFLSRMTGWLSRIYPERRVTVTRYVQNTSPDIPDAAMEAFRREILHQFLVSRNYLASLFSLDLPQVREARVENASPGAGSYFSVQTYRDIEELHGELFQYYARIDARELEPWESEKLEEYLRSSRSIMNATMNLKEVCEDIDGFELTDGDFLGGQASAFRERLAELMRGLDPVAAGMAETGERDRVGEDATLGGTDEGYKASALERLENLFEEVEVRDLACIQEGSRAIREGDLDDLAATNLLMVNRLFTQSCRMLVLSLRNLLGEKFHAQD